MEVLAAAIAGAARSEDGATTATTATTTAAGATRTTTAGGSGARIVTPTTIAITTVTVTAIGIDLARAPGRVAVPTRGRTTTSRYRVDHSSHMHPSTPSRPRLRRRRRIEHERPAARIVGTRENRQSDQHAEKSEDGATEILLRDETTRREDGAIPNPTLTGGKLILRDFQLTLQTVSVAITRRQASSLLSSPWTIKAGTRFVTLSSISQPRSLSHTIPPISFPVTKAEWALNIHVTALVCVA